MEEITPQNCENTREIKEINQKMGLDEKIFYFSIGCVFLTFSYVFAITFLQIPKDNQRYADICLGFLLGTLVGTIITYYFGSSNSSKNKQDAINRLMEK